MRLTLLILLITLVSCGLPKQQGSSSSTSVVKLSAAMEQARSLNASELALATEVCNAFKYKRINYPSTFMGYFFKFQNEQYVCTQATPQSYLITSQLVGDQYLTTDAGDYFKNIETDSNGILSTICTSLASSMVPSNSELVGLNSLRQFSFEKNSDSAVVVGAVYGTKVDGATAFTSYKSDQLLVLISSSSVPSFRGMVTERRTREVCASGSTNAEKSLYSVFSP